jgi:hypothetical protein
VKVILKELYYTRESTVKSSIWIHSTRKKSLPY